MKSDILGDTVIVLHELIPMQNLFVDGKKQFTAILKCWSKIMVYEFRTLSRSQISNIESLERRHRDENFFAYLGPAHGVLSPGIR